MGLEFYGGCIYDVYLRGWFIQGVGIFKGSLYSTGGWYILTIGECKKSVGELQGWVYSTGGLMHGFAKCACIRGKGEPWKACGGILGVSSRSGRPMTSVCGFGPGREDKGSVNRCGW
jgi:hypothetical protein